MVRDGYDVIVAGGGLAGLTAALTSARLGRSVLVLAGGVPGGLLLAVDRVEGVPGYPDGVAGYELCPTVQTQADTAGAEIAGLELDALRPADGGWSVTTAEDDTHARTVIVATGASFRNLGVPGEERLQGRGVSTCASCDGPLLGGKTAAVIGGGDSALQEALTLAELGARVVLLHRGEELDGQETYRRRVAEQPAIEVRYRSVVEEIVGDAFVEAVRVRTNNAVEELEVGGVFPFVGLQPLSERVADLVELDGDGAVRTDAALATSAPGVFAAGIVRSGAAGRAAAAAGDGAAAALAAHAYLNGGPSRAE